MSIESRRELELTRTKLELLEDRLTAPRPRTRRESPRPRMVGSLAQTNHQSNERRNRPFREPLQGRCPEILNPPTVACHPALGVPTRPAAFRTKPNENALRVWTWLAQLRMSRWALAPAKGGDIGLVAWSCIIRHQFGTVTHNEKPGFAEKAGPLCDSLIVHPIGELKWRFPEVLRSQVGPERVERRCRQNGRTSYIDVRGLRPEGITGTLAAC